MRPFVHWTLAWTASFAVTFALLAATAFVRGQVEERWQSVSGALQGVALLLVLSVTGGVVIAGIGAFFDRLGWSHEPPRRPVKNPIVRAALLPVLILATCALSWVLGVR
jgi:hypothetical protein